MTSDKKLFTLRPTADGKDGQRILTHGADDLANREAAAKRDRRDYTVSDLPK